MVFNQGLGGSDYVIIGLSKTSVQKPWVREEMDVATVMRIDGQCRIIPVTLDDDVVVPTALIHLLRRSATGPGGISALAEILIRDIFGAGDRPPLGAPPAFAIHRSRRPDLPDPIDDIVFQAVIDLLRRHDALNWCFVLDDFKNELVAGGISEDAYVESMDLLIRNGFITATSDYSGRRFSMAGSPVTAYRWLAGERRNGVDTDALMDQALLAIANKGSLDDLFEGVPARTAHAVLDQLQTGGYIRYVISSMGRTVDDRTDIPRGASRSSALRPLLDRDNVRKRRYHLQITLDQTSPSLPFSTGNDVRYTA